MVLPGREWRECVQSTGLSEPCKGAGTEVAEEAQQDDLLEASQRFHQIYQNLLSEADRVLPFEV
jgi:hypothetical protein